MSPETRKSVSTSGSLVSKATGFPNGFLVRCLKEGLFHTSLRDLHVLFYDIRYVGKYPTREFLSFYTS